MVARALAIAVPWLALLPIGNAALVVALYACAIAASFHGWGIAIARRRDVAPLRAIQWGIATAIGIAGLAIAIGCFTATVEAALLFGGVAIHTVAIASWWWTRSDASASATMLVVPHRWIAPVAVLAVIGAIAVIGSAGEIGRPFDDDGNVLGELRRLADTGALGDGVGYPRAFQLGGHVALAAFANVVGDPRVMRMIDALAMVLALGYAISRMRQSPLWAMLVVIAAAALALPVSDPSPMWLGIGLMLALFDGETPAIPLGVVAGALIVLRLAFAPLAIVGLVWRRSFAAATAAAAVVVPYVISALRATHAPTPISSGLGKLAIAAAIVVALLPLTVVALRELRGLAFASAAGLGGIAAQLTGDHAARFAWAIAIACVLALAIELAHRPHSTVAMLCSLVLCVLVLDGRDATGRAGWYRRTADLVDNIEYLAHTTLAAPPDLDAILDSIPADALVVMWLPEPERLDHSHHRLIDLRTPRLAPLRDHRFDNRPPELEAFIASLGARYALISPDDAAAQHRIQLPRKAICATPSPKCEDGIERLLHHPIIARRDGLVLVDLTARTSP